jgi:predicted TIM-barrel fold metal-dependent hydrolase
MEESAQGGPPEHNVTGIDYGRRQHLTYTGTPIFDTHAHVTVPREGPDGGLFQAEQMMEVAAEFGVERVWSMCPPEDIAPLRERFGSRLHFTGSITRKADDPPEAPQRLLDRFLEAGVDMLKFWSAPRGRERGLFVDAPWRVEAARRARAAGVRAVLVHVADPDVWFRTTYADAGVYGTKPEQYAGLERMLQLFPDLTWIAAHMGGDPEHPDHLEALLDCYPHLHFDTSATKWQVREVSAHRDAARSLVCRRPDRFLFGSDLVTRPGLPREHYVSRYWCQRTLWESTWEGRSPIADMDFTREPGGPPTPLLCGLGLPQDVLAQVYYRNAARLLGGSLG